MYEDLVKHLRNRANGSYQEKCEGCEYTEDFPPCVHCTIKAFNDAADVIEDLIAALTASNEVIAKNKPRWIPVTERLPEEYMDVLCYYEYFRYGDYNCMFRTIDRGYYGNGIWGGEAGQGHKNKVLAWMPLPEPPKEET